MKIINLGYPRIGRSRELKLGLDGYFSETTSRAELLAVGQKLCEERWRRQKELGVDSVPLGDFSFMDHILDTSLLLGVVPQRFRSETDWFSLQFDMARGKGSEKGLGIRKWFNTNYHTFVPEISSESLGSPCWDKLRFEIDLAKEQADIRFHPVLVGPWTFLKLSHIDGMSFNEAIDRILPRYIEVLKELSRGGFDHVQMDEPFLCHDLVREDLRVLRKIYDGLTQAGCPLWLTPYYGSPEPWLSEIANLPCEGFHFDLLYWTTTSAWLKTRAFPRNKQMSVGIVSGRNVWASPLWDRKEELQGLVDLYGANRMVLAPTCTLLHLPHDKTLEKQWDPEFSSWVSFADQRLEELAFLKRAINGDRNVETLLKQRQAALAGRSVSARVHRPEVKQAVARIEAKQSARAGTPVRGKSISVLNTLPLLPTTTVGSFPQTAERRKIRQEWKRGKLNDEQYKKAILEEIESDIRFQEKLGLDVLVHGEAERGDMVEFFAEHWDGIAFASQGWVQSLGSKCVRPPLIFGDVRRRSPASVSWFIAAQAMTEKPVKAILTGPVTVLNWSFVREDQVRQKTAYQIALALREEAVDLEKAGAKIVQIDEAALREGLPMMKVHWNQYLRWALEAFQTVASGLGPKVQVHAHFCYSAFEDIADVLCQLGTDVLLVECSRGGNALLSKISKHRSVNAIAPGVFDVHSKEAATEEACRAQIEQSLKYFSARQIWVSPDCGLKAMPRELAETSLRAMVKAAESVRSTFKSEAPMVSKPSDSVATGKRKAS
jgi:5-methyltetrahydropteroyltriglutamate--homocysteine methyltransferase